MAARPKAASPAAESKAAGEKASAELAAMLEDAEPKDAEQPKPAKKNGGNGKAKDEANKPKAEAKPKQKKLTKLSEVDGKVADGETVRVGVAMMGGAREGEIIAKKVIVPKKFSLVKPTKGHMVHVVDADHTDVTLCTLKTNWASGATPMTDDTPITCDPCLWRMLAIKKTTQAEQDKRMKAARARADKIVADQKAKVEAAKKEIAEKKEAAAAKAEAKPQAKPDPKPAASGRKRKAA